MWNCCGDGCNMPTRNNILIRLDSIELFVSHKIYRKRVCCNGSLTERQIYSRVGYAHFHYSHLAVDSIRRCLEYKYNFAAWIKKEKKNRILFALEADIYCTLSALSFGQQRNSYFVSLNLRNRLFWVWSGADQFERMQCVLRTKCTYICLHSHLSYSLSVLSNSNALYCTYLFYCRPHTIDWHTSQRSTTH